MQWSDVSIQQSDLIQGPEPSQSSQTIDTTVMPVLTLHPVVGLPRFLARFLSVCLSVCRYFRVKDAVRAGAADSAGEAWLHLWALHVPAVQAKCRIELCATYAWFWCPGLLLYQSTVHCLRWWNLGMRTAGWFSSSLQNILGSAER